MYSFGNRQWLRNPVGISVDLQTTPARDPPICRFPEDNQQRARDVVNDP